MPLVVRKLLLSRVSKNLAKHVPKIGELKRRLKKAMLANAKNSCPGIRRKIFLHDRPRPDDVRIGGLLNRKLLGSLILWLGHEADDRIGISGVVATKVFVRVVFAVGKGVELHHQIRECFRHVDHARIRLAARSLAGNANGDGLIVKENGLLGRMGVEIDAGALGPDTRHGHLEHLAELAERADQHVDFHLLRHAGDGHLALPLQEFGFFDRRIAETEDRVADFPRAPEIGEDIRERNISRSLVARGWWRVQQSAGAACLEMLPFEK